MSSYHGENTIAKMNDMRRQTKRKQQKGTGLSGPKVEREEEKVFISRHFVAEFADQTIEALVRNMQEHEKEFSTVYNLKHLLKSGGLYLKTTYNGLSAPQIVHVTEQGFKAVLEMKDGFKTVIVMKDGKPVYVDMAFKTWSLTVMLKTFPVQDLSFGIVFKFDDREGKMWIN